MQKNGIQITYKTPGQGLHFISFEEFLEYVEHVRNTALAQFSGEGEQEGLNIVEFIIPMRSQAAKLFQDALKAGMEANLAEEKHYSDVELNAYTIRLIHSWAKEQD